MYSSTASDISPQKLCIFSIFWSVHHITVQQGLFKLYITYSLMQMLRDKQYKPYRSCMYFLKKCSFKLHSLQALSESIKQLTIRIVSNCLYKYFVILMWEAPSRQFLPLLFITLALGASQGHYLPLIDKVRFMFILAPKGRKA